MKIADGELRQILAHDLKLPAEMVRELVADARQSNHDLLTVVLGSGQATEAHIAKAQAKRIGVPFIDLETDPAPTQQVLSLPLQIAAKYHAICFDQTNTSVKIAMADPRDEAARKALRHYFHKTVRRYQATASGLRAGMQIYRQYSDTPLPLSTRELLSTVLDQAIRNGSRDIHFEPLTDELLVKFRAGQKLQIVSRLPIKRYQPLLAWCKLHSGGSIEETQKPHHGRFDLRIQGTVHSVMVNTLPTIAGQKLMLRIVPPSQAIPDLITIGYLGDQAEELSATLADGRGLVIIAGHSSAQITTTLASLAVRASQQPHQTITTVEEPIGYLLPFATQIEVTRALPLQAVIDAAITQNPSTLITSDLGRPPATEQLVDFSLSGHLVIAGMYATDLLGVMKRLRSFPMAPALIAASLRIVAIEHRLPTLCRSCRTSFVPTGPLAKALATQFGFKNSVKLYRQGPGCSVCKNGYDNTVTVVEQLVISREFQQLLASGADEQSLKTYIDNHGSFAQELGKRAQKGIIGIDQATQLLA